MRSVSLLLGPYGNEYDHTQCEGEAGSTEYVKPTNKEQSQHPQKHNHGLNEKKRF
jgi:hypothetical protein